MYAISNISLAMIVISIIIIMVPFALFNYPGYFPPMAYAEAIPYYNRYAPYALAGTASVFILDMIFYSLIMRAKC